MLFISNIIAHVIHLQYYCTCYPSPILLHLLFISNITAPVIHLQYYCTCYSPLTSFHHKFEGKYTYPGEQLTRKEPGTKGKLGEGKTVDVREPEVPII